MSIFSQLCNAFCDMHSQNILHRDLKIENILIHNNQIKISDLGLSSQL